MNRAFVVVSISVATLLASSAAFGADRGFYASIKFGTTNVDQSLGRTFDQVIDGEEDSQAYEFGFRFSRFMAVQGAFHDFGNFPGIGVPCRQGDAVCPELGEVLVPVRSDTKAYSAAVVPQLPLPLGLSAFAKIGVVFWESDVESVGFGSLGSFSDEDLILGLGARFKLIGPLSVFAEWERIGDDIETVSLGLTASF